MLVSSVPYQIYDHPSSFTCIKSARRSCHMWGVSGPLGILSSMRSRLLYDLHEGNCTLLNSTAHPKLSPLSERSQSIHSTNGVTDMVFLMTAEKLFFFDPEVLGKTHQVYISRTLPPKLYFFTPESIQDPDAFKYSDRLYQNDWQSSSSSCCCGSSRSGQGQRAG